MKRTIFYSWQSDLPNNTNRNIIEDSLRSALKDIQKEPESSIAPIIDRDTANTPGSPDISDTIFTKIASADFFIADLSIINKNTDSRKVPNPNILLELGFAVSQLGWENILLIQNIAYGYPEDLPFDLRARRLFTYYLDENSDSNKRTEEKKRLRTYFKTAIRSILDTRIKKPSTPWWGYWDLGTEHTSYNGVLFIREISSDEFLFQLTVVNGAHTGLITHRAKIMSHNIAYARIEYEENICEIRFERKVLDDHSLINIEETASCHYYRGIGASFEGNFIYRKNSLLDLGFLTPIDLQRIYFLLGEKHYNSLMLNMSLISSNITNEDNFSATVYTGGIRGLYTIMEGIIMLSPTGALWIAFIDNGILRYFSNIIEWKEIIPKTINTWKKRFDDMPIIMNNPDNFVDIFIH